MARSAQLADLFRSPALVAQRNYEICKAYYLDQATAEQLAERFSLHPDSVRAIVRDFAHDPDIRSPVENRLVVETCRHDGCVLRNGTVDIVQIQSIFPKCGRSKVP